jgi:predicted DNA-binding transcriptional regulator AlpA
MRKHTAALLSSTANVARKSRERVVASHSQENEHVRPLATPPPLGGHEESSQHESRGRRVFQPGGNNDDPLIGTTVVATELMCHPVSVFRFMRDRPDFPVPIRISANRLAWRLSVIRAYVASRPLRERKTEGA